MASQHWISHAITDVTELSQALTGILQGAAEEPRVEDEGRERQAVHPDCEAPFSSTDEAHSSAEGKKNQKDQNDVVTVSAAKLQTMLSLCASIQNRLEAHGAQSTVLWGTFSDSADGPPPALPSFQATGEQQQQQQVTGGGGGGSGDDGNPELFLLGADGGILASYQETTDSEDVKAWLNETFSTVKSSRKKKPPQPTTATTTAMVGSGSGDPNTQHSAATGAGGLAVGGTTGTFVEGLSSGSGLADGGRTLTIRKKPHQHQHHGPPTLTSSCLTPALQHSSSQHSAAQASPVALEQTIPPTRPSSGTNLSNSKNATPTRTTDNNYNNNGGGGGDIVTPPIASLKGSPRKFDEGAEDASEQVVQPSYQGKDGSLDHKRQLGEEDRLRSIAPLVASRDNSCVPTPVDPSAAAFPSESSNAETGNVETSKEEDKGDNDEGNNHDSSSIPVEEEGTNAFPNDSIACGDDLSHKYSRKLSRKQSAVTAHGELHRWLREYDIPFLPVDSADFNIFDICDEFGEDKVFTFVCCNVIFRYSFVTTWSLDIEKIVNFLESLRQAYSFNNPYHNSLHAADVTQSVHVYLCQEGVKANFNDDEIFMLLLSAMIHDVGHLGCANAFLTQLGHPLAWLYNDISPLESMHAALGFFLLEQPTNNFLDFASYTEQSNLDYGNLKTTVSEIVAGTDMRHHAAMIKGVRDILEDGKIDDEEIPLLLKAILHMADLSNPLKPLKVYQNWIDRVIAEFWRQGDVQRERGLPISMMCDRYNTIIAKAQVGFINYVVDPFVQEFASLLPDIWLTRMKDNLAYMAGLGNDEYDTSQIERYAKIPWEDGWVEEKHHHMFALALRSRSGDTTASSAIEEKVNENANKRNSKKAADLLARFDTNMLDIGGEEVPLEMSQSENTLASINREDAAASAAGDGGGTSEGKKMEESQDLSGAQRKKEEEREQKERGDESGDIIGQRQNGGRPCPNEPSSCVTVSGVGSFSSTVETTSSQLIVFFTQMQNTCTRLIQQLTLRLAYSATSRKGNEKERKDHGEDYLSVDELERFYATFAWRCVAAIKKMIGVCGVSRANYLINSPLDDTCNSSVSCTSPRVNDLSRLARRNLSQLMLENGLMKEAEYQDVFRTPLCMALIPPTCGNPSSPDDEAHHGGGNNNNNGIPTLCFDGEDGDGDGAEQEQKRQRGGRGGNEDSIPSANSSQTSAAAAATTTSPRKTPQASLPGKKSSLRKKKQQRQTEKGVVVIAHSRDHSSPPGDTAITVPSPNRFENKDSNTVVSGGEITTQTTTSKNSSKPESSQSDGQHIMDESSCSPTGEKEKEKKEAEEATVRLVDGDASEEESVPISKIKAAKFCVKTLAARRIAETLPTNECVLVGEVCRSWDVFYKHITEVVEEQRKIKEETAAAEVADQNTEKERNDGQTTINGVAAADKNIGAAASEPSVQKEGTRPPRNPYALLPLYTSKSRSRRSSLQNSIPNQNNGSMSNVNVSYHQGSGVYGTTAVVSNSGNVGVEERGGTRSSIDPNSTTAAAVPMLSTAGPSPIAYGCRWSLFGPSSSNVILANSPQQQQQQQQQEERPENVNGSVRTSSMNCHYNSAADDDEGKDGTTENANARKTKEKHHHHHASPGYGATTTPGATSEKKRTKKKHQRPKQPHEEEEEEETTTLGVDTYNNNNNNHNPYLNLSSEDEYIHGSRHSAEAYYGVVGPGEMATPDIRSTTTTTATDGAGRGVDNSTTGTSPSSQGPKSSSVSNSVQVPPPTVLPPLHATELSPQRLPQKEPPLLVSGEKRKEEKALPQPVVANRRLLDPIVSSDDAVNNVHSESKGARSKKK